MRSTTLRGQLLRWLLVPLSILFLLDAAGSYVVATRAVVATCTTAS